VKEFHTRPLSSVTVEGHGVLAFCRVAAALNQAICKVGLAGAELAQGLQYDFRSLDY
jgi:hypothetical protein